MSFRLFKLIEIPIKEISYHTLNKFILSSYNNMVKKAETINILDIQAAIDWAVTPFENGITYKSIKPTQGKTKKEIHDEAQKREKEMGE